MAISTAHPLDLPRHQAFWSLQAGGWLAYFALGSLQAVAYGKPAGYWIVPFTAACTGFVATAVLRQLLRACWRLKPAQLAAAMVLPPFFWKGQNDAAVAHGIGSVIEGVKDTALRVILYHIPQVSAVSIDAGAIGLLRKRFGAVVAGIKDSSADFVHFDTALTAYPDMLHFAGAEPQFARVLEVGGAGTICGLGNVAPKIMARLRDGRSAAQDAQREIEACCRFLVGRPFLQTTRAMLAALTGEKAWLRTRAPLVAFDDAQAAEVSSAMGRLSGLG